MMTVYKLFCLRNRRKDTKLIKEKEKKGKKEKQEDTQEATNIMG